MRLAVLLSLVAALLGSSGCIVRSLPLPPPGARVTTQACDDCPAGGLTVRIEGIAQPGALVVVQNISRTFADGRVYAASAFATVRSSDGGTSSEPGRYVVVLFPIPDPPRPTVASQLGDTIVIYQLVRNADGAYEMSESTSETLR